MDFTRAFKYPFHNSPKVLSIVLTLTIMITICVVFIAGSHDWSPYVELTEIHGTMDQLEDLDYPGSAAFLGFLGLLALMILGGFWLNGYSVEVIRAIMRNYDTMPGVEVGANLRRGFWVFLSSLWYGIVALLLAVALLILVGIFSSLSSLVGTVVSIGALFLVIAYVFVAGWAYFVGLARYARAGDRSALFAILRNMRIAREHRGLSIRLSAFMIALMIIYGTVKSIVDSLIGGFMGPDVVVATVISILTYYAFNLFQHFSTQHLIAQYALAIAASDYDLPDKEKPDYQ
ncbi:MAG: DUF4013 domain-containing protein [Chloroflexota bacterium]|nr:DUF4013 domain-containing protein [Chloroflexota bacterium]